MKSSFNPRTANGALRKRYRQRFRAMGLPCALCGKKIDYDLPYLSPGAFQIDEIVPVSRWREGGFSSPREAAETWSNLQPVHRACNAAKSNKMNFSIKRERPRRRIVSDGDW